MINHEIIFKKKLPMMNGDSKNARRELFPMNRMFTETHSVGSRGFMIDDSFLQEDHDFRFKFLQRPFDLRLSVGNSFDNHDLDDEEVNLSLSIGRSTRKRSRISEKYWNNKIVIDLEEESTETGSNEAALPVYSLDQGSNNSHEVKRTIPLDLDLNKDQPEESSFHSNEPSQSYPSSNGSNNESCSRISKASTSTPTSKQQPKSQTSYKDSQTKTYTIDLESLPEPSSEFSEENEIQFSEVIEQKETKDSYSMLQKAALSLVSISQLPTSNINQDSKISNEIKKKTMTRSSSIDSYESLVLKLEENSVDEDSATSKAFEMIITESDEKEKNGIKLRRGSRMKDFQKDILPTISSLSRHEIWEDISILESVIRSREYKRLNKAKSGKGKKWFTPVKNKRSKVNYVGQRC